MANYRPVEIAFLVLLLAFTAANIGTEGRYLMKRLEVCNNLNLDNCTQQKSTYLFGTFRNLTMKVFVDCINLGFIIASFFAVIFVKKEYAPNVSRGLFVIVLALSLMSLGCGIQSIDQEDTYNEQTFGPKLDLYCSAEAQYQNSTALYQAKRDQYNQALQIPANKQYIKAFQSGDKAMYIGARGYIDFAANYTQFADQTTLQQSQRLVALIDGEALLKQAKDQLDAAQPQVELAKRACPEITDFKNIYQRYRDSVVALVIINFVWAYSILLHAIFRWNIEQDDNRVKITGTATDLKLQEYKSNDLLKVPNTDIEMNAQNAM
ncbi:transmembrane protein, putative (macronuclear) [Tetrahymena thermophila SB210]|uniref:Transmembrane protein, putative n=1 Tax=Tetrahymena thermophila (strain SB210) TaxID=312017 RepID=Q23RV9_TETTS|nr:transmembrane protein, putative [Tetrahymena thermophila SB210]EAR99280.1 transmembrane protein, putative [Tetrahymena thermophila SB210]|eukprot:XP_001019525.1 transmembrane protein, putative [Tetrahymena thermophila SB210]